LWISGGDPTNLAIASGQFGCQSNWVPPQKKQPEVCEEFYSKKNKASGNQSNVAMEHPLEMDVLTEEIIQWGIFHCHV
jgi:hypothetical protein